MSSRIRCLRARVRTPVPAESTALLVEVINENQSMRRLIVAPDLRRDADAVRFCDALAKNDRLESVDVTGARLCGCCRNALAHFFFILPLGPFADVNETNVDSVCRMLRENKALTALDFCAFPPRRCLLSLIDLFFRFPPKFVQTTPASGA